MNDVDMLVLTTGSHTIGGAFKANSPGLPIFQANPGLNFAPFDDTPGVFDNNVFVKLQKNPNDCILPIDCSLSQDPALKPLSQMYAVDQNAFFKQYSISFQKLLELTGNAAFTNVINVQIQRVPYVPPTPVSSSTSAYPTASPNLPPISPSPSPPPPAPLGTGITLADIQSSATQLSGILPQDGNGACVGEPGPNWLRAAFHDAGTFLNGAGGADGSLVNELNAPQNAGVRPLPP
jgi:catalase (peroxidase I)